jgi:Plavaka transposase
MLVPVIAGSDKTTVSVATGHQEYHPVYTSIGNISNTARRAHGNGVIPVAFLPIPKGLSSSLLPLILQLILGPPASKRQRKKTAFQKFCRQLYHKCLEVVFSPIKPYMTTPKVVRCPDQHFRRAIFSLGPYIADYPEQVWLSGIVSRWCPKYGLHNYLNL